MWVPISSIDKVSDSWIKDLEFNSHLHQKTDYYLGLMIKSYHQERTPYVEILWKKKKKKKTQLFLSHFQTQFCSYSFLGWLSQMSTKSCLRVAYMYGNHSLLKVAKFLGCPNFCLSSGRSFIIGGQNGLLPISHKLSSKMPNIWN